ncbi:MAG: glycine zipper 2TM domain-containing protein [Lysobacterales bacterium]
MKRTAPALLAASLSLLLGACASDSGYYDARGPESRYSDHRDHRETRCDNCGRVERIQRYNGRGDSSGAGAVIGAVVGGVAGNQIGDGDGRTAATVAGAVAGGVIGNEIEKNRNNDGFELYIRTDDGRAIIARQNDLNGIREGDRVQVRGDHAYLLR